MLAILHALGMFIVDLFKSRRRLVAENLFLRATARMGLMARGLVRTCPRRNEFFLDLVVNPFEPLLGSLGAILELIALNLQVFVSILCGAQLDRKFVRQAHSAFALVVRQIGCLLEQPNDRLSGLIQLITRITRRFFLGRKLQQLARTRRVGADS